MYQNICWILYHSAILAMFLEALYKHPTDEFQTHNQRISIKLGAHPTDHPYFGWHFVFLTYVDGVDYYIFIIAFIMNI